ncbi:3'-5' exonuclease [Corynebacterium hadale]|uniref:3'-5' exonuclease n=1 Tax=Corynebacterium hadale TaxID=2026255 RepID=UPI000BAA8250|nr:3'-5' exonuclease [Corynebacterium hadale]PAT12440.1 DNA helicase [Corynebacterium hadale]
MVTFSLYGGLKLDGSLMKPTMDFLQTLAADPTNPSLNIKTIKNSVDKRVRTGRINDQFRAVLFELRDGDVHHFVLVHVDSHDEGIESARRFDPARLELRANAVNGITELIERTAPDGADDSDAHDPEVSDSQRKAEEAAREAEELAKAQAGITPVELKPEEVPPRIELEKRGYTPALLHDELGVDETIAEMLFVLTRESQLVALMQGRPKWETEAVEGLVAGYTIDNVKEMLNLTTGAAGKAAEQPGSEDARILAGLKQDAAQLEFAYVDDVDTDSLRSVIESGSFDQWRVYIHPEQRRIVEGDHKGSARVFGGAGTGKTVVAVHRANHLLKRGQPRVLLTTFTDGLAGGLRQQMAALNPNYPAAEPGEPGLCVTNIDKLVRHVITAAAPADVEEATRRVLGTGTSRVRPYSNDEAARVWGGLLLVDATVADSLPAGTTNETFLQREYEGVVLANSITTKAEYLKVARTGRGTPLSRAQRKVVWTLLQSAMQTQAVDGKLFWPTMSAVGAELLRIQRDRTDRALFDHVVVDEAQDFNAGHWRFLRACVDPGPNDIFLAEDSHQRIYGQPLVLSRFGISTRGKASRKLTLNYRTTKENLDYAVRILSAAGEFTDSAGETDDTHGYRSARSGPNPQLLRCATPDEEFDAAAAYINYWLDADEVHEPRIGVMCRTRGQLSRIVSGLADHGIDAVQTKDAAHASGEQVAVMTMHGAKGMEFTHVILMSVGRDILPQPFRLAGLSDDDRAAALQQERSLLYVAASRARDALVITTVGEQSELLPEV